MRLFEGSGTPFGADWWLEDPLHCVDSRCAIDYPLDSLLLGDLVASLLQELEHSLFRLLTIALFGLDVSFYAIDHLSKELENVFISFISICLLLIHSIDDFFRRCIYASLEVIL